MFPIGGVARDAVVVDDPDLDTPALAVHYHIGDTSPCYLDHMWSQKVPGVPTTNAAGTLKIYEQITVPQYDTLNNQDCPSEVYFRYYLKLNDNYQCAVEGKKLPGIAGRYGYWNSLGTDKGYYQVVNGNGGSPTKGTKIVGSAYPGGFYYSGWSMRHIAWAGPTDNNPYGDRVAAGTYAYHAAMTGFYGDTWRWGTPSIGWIIYEPERWYCIEQYVKMNTLSGPYDALGNACRERRWHPARRIDGVMVFEKKDIVFRKPRDSCRQRSGSPTTITAALFLRKRSTGSRWRISSCVRHRTDARVSTGGARGPVTGDTTVAAIETHQSVDRCPGHGTHRIDGARCKPRRTHGWPVPQYRLRDPRRGIAGLQRWRAKEESGSGC